MKRILFLALIFSLSTTCTVKAQTEVTKKDVKNVIKNLSDKKAKDALKYARTLYTPDAKKELENIVKVMDESELRLLNDYLELINKYADKKEKEDKAKMTTAEEPKRKMAKLKFESKTYDFGTVEQGYKSEHTFKFMNTGNDDLLIMTVKSTCGCTIPEWPKEPIPPGGIGEIKLKFDSTSKLGVQSKRVTIFANTEPQSTFLFVVGEIMKKRE